MQVYLLRGADDEGALRSIDGFQWAGRGGVSFAGLWPTPALSTHDGLRWRRLDCFALSAPVDGVVLSDASVTALADLVLGAGEFWPVLVEGFRYRWLNVLAEADVLSDTTEGVWAEGFLVSVRRLVFRPAALAAAPSIFRVPELPSGYLFVRERFVSAVADLSGFRFDLVWSAAGGGVADAPGLGALGT